MRRQTLTIGAVVGAVLIAGTGVAFAQTQGSSGSYRTATVTRGDVEKTIDLTGTVAASARRDLSFGTSGSVKSVKVKAGQTVKSGQVLATLDPTDLDAAVTKAKETLATAHAQFETDQNSQASTVATAAKPSAPISSAPSSSKPSSPSLSSPSSSPDGGVSPEVTAALATLKGQQDAVASAQTEATATIAAAKTALSTQMAACKNSDSSSDEGDVSTDGATGLSEACSSALAAVQAAQDVVADKQDALQTALETLSATLTRAVAALEKTNGSNTAPSTGKSSSNGSSSKSSSAAGSAPSTSSAPSSGGGTGATPRANSIAQDQAAIDTAEAQLTEAKLTADMATLTAPFSGKLLSVSVTKGDTVDLTAVAVVLVGSGTTTATTTVTIDQIPDVERGQTATVTPAGSATVTATVTAIGLLPNSNNGTTTYPVTLELEGTTSAREGTTASISLVVGTVNDALIVPSSAVSTARRTTVSVLSDGKVTPTTVTVGVVGPTRTSITKGLKQGQQIVLADLEATLPSGGNTTTIGGRGGGFGGGSRTVPLGVPPR